MGDCDFVAAGAAHKEMDVCFMIIDFVLDQFPGVIGVFVQSVSDILFMEAFSHQLKDFRMDKFAVIVSETIHLKTFFLEMIIPKESHFVKKMGSFKAMMHHSSPLLLFKH